MALRRRAIVRDEWRLLPARSVRSPFLGGPQAALERSSPQQRETSPSHLRRAHPPGPTDRWLGVPTDEEEGLLARAVPTVLDVGCGPGRHVAALQERGIPALGLELDERFVRMARGRGVDVLQGSIFAPLAEEGPWGSALLLDGNIGLGADPVRLVNRLASLVEPGGSILAELSPPAMRCEDVMVRSRTMAPLVPGSPSGWWASMRSTTSPGAQRSTWFDCWGSGSGGLPSCGSEAVW